MKFNDFGNRKKVVNEIDLSSLFGQYGSAALKGGLSSLFGKASGQLSATDRIAREKFIKDFVGKTALQLNDIVKMQQAGSSASLATLVTPAQSSSTSVRPTVGTRKTVGQTSAQSAATTSNITARKRVSAKKVAPTPTSDTSGTSVVPAGQPTTVKPSRTKNPTKTIKENSTEQLNEQVTVSSWLVNKVENYLQGFDLSSYKSYIEQKAMEVEKAYGKGGFFAQRAISKPLKDLASLIYTIVNSETTKKADSQVDLNTGSPAYLKIVGLLANMTDQQKMYLLNNLTRTTSY